MAGLTNAMIFGSGIADFMCIKSNTGGRYFSTIS